MATRFAHRSYHALAEIDPAARQQGRRSDRRLRQFPAAALRAGGDPARYSSAGTRSTRRPTGTARSKATRAGASSTPSCSTNSMYCRNSSKPALRIRQGRGIRGRRLPCSRGSRRKNGVAAPRVVASGDPRRIPARLGADCDPATGARRRDGAHRTPPKCANATASNPIRCPTSSRCAVTRRTRSPVHRGSARKPPPTSCAATARSKPRSRKENSQPRRTAAPLPLDSRHGRHSPPPLPAGPDPNLGRSGRPRSRLGAEPPSRPPHRTTIGGPSRPLAPSLRFGSGAALRTPRCGKPCRGAWRLPPRVRPRLGRGGAGRR